MLSARLAPATIVLAMLAGCTATDTAVPPPSPDQAAAPGPARSGCGSPVETGPLPEWARAGFTGDARIPHVMGDRGAILGVLFGHPLAVSRLDGISNKVLWVAKTTPQYGDLVIDAKLAGSTVSVQRRVLGGPGPSIIDLPEPGCWHLTLTWPDHTDNMDLIYR